MNSAVIILSCIVFLIAQRSTIAINCYQCDQGTDGCGVSTFNKAGGGVVAMSDSSAAYCIKITYPSNANAATRYYTPTGTTCTAGNSTVFGVNMMTFCCATELCNGACNRSGNVILAMITAVVGHFLTK